MKLKRIAVSATFIAIAAWLLLFFSSHGILVWSEQFRAPEHSQDTLACYYFTGLSVVKKEFWYAPNDFMGRSVCASLYDFR